MSKVTEIVRQHHRKLAATLDRQVELLKTGALGDAAELLSFLNNELMPHAAGEERAMYPRVDRLVHDHGHATATMSVDHEFIGDLVHAIEQTAGAVRSASGVQKERAHQHLRDLAIQLEAILRLHTEKEERVYLPLVEKYVAEPEQHQMFKAMHEAPHSAAPQHAGNGGSCCGHGEHVLDVRELAPRERHPLIFGTFSALAPAQSFVLVNDHDPKPLYYHFKAELGDGFSWDYLESGPEVWRVRIGRVAA